jgi:hypothetical protein
VPGVQPVHPPHPTQARQRNRHRRYASETCSPWVHGTCRTRVSLCASRRTHILILAGQISLAMVRRLCSTVTASSATTAGSSVRSAACSKTCGHVCKFSVPTAIRGLEENPKKFQFCFCVQAVHRGIAAGLSDSTAKQLSAWLGVTSGWVASMVGAACLDLAGLIATGSFRRSAAGWQHAVHDLTCRLRLAARWCWAESRGSHALGCR